MNIILFFIFYLYKNDKYIFIFYLYKNDKYIQLKTVQPRLILKPQTHKQVLNVKTNLLKKSLFRI